MKTCILVFKEKLIAQNILHGILLNQDVYNKLNEMVPFVFSKRKSQELLKLKVY